MFDFLFDCSRLDFSRLADSFKGMHMEKNPYLQLTDDGIRQFMMQSDSFYPPDAVNLSVGEQRALYNEMSAHFRKPRPDNVRVENLSVANGSVDVPIRIYSPGGSAGLPVMLYLHGGGFVVGDLESHDDICAEIAERANVHVIAVDYRLAPEHRFPAAFEDCRAVLNSLEGLGVGFGFDVSRLVIGGDSAGGCLAAGLSIRARDEGGPEIAGQVLIYPGLGGDTSKGSYVSQASAPGLSATDIGFYSALYLGPPDDPGHQNKYALPLLETDYSRLPPAFLVAAHNDPLCDDCSDYAARLNDAGVAASVREEPLLVHAFLRARHISKPAAVSFSAIVQAIRKYTGVENRKG